MVDREANGAIIRTEDLWKTYTMGVGNVIHALQSVTLHIQANGPRQTDCNLSSFFRAR